MTDTRIEQRAPRIGESAPRPDGIPKVDGSFTFSSDLWHDRMLWGGTLRSPHPSARIRSIDIGPAVAVAGVYAVLTATDVPGNPDYGLEHVDQPVLATDVVRYEGEPVAIVAADHPEAVRLALDAIVVDYELTAPLVDPGKAESSDPIHPDGNLIRRIHLSHGDQDVVGEVVVEGTYEVGMQDQAFLGPESGLAVPAEDGGVDLFIATQWLHGDRDQVAACLGIEPDLVRLTLAGVGGAFGAREDLSLHVHLCLLALYTRRPVKMVYSREESFHGHVHRHPARMWYRHHADRAGNLVRVEARLLLDGGAYASSSSAVIANATCFAAGPYRIPSADIEGVVVRTNNPPCGPCAASAPSRPVSDTRPRWTAWPPPSARIPSNCGCRTSWPPVTACSPARSSPVPHRSPRYWAPAPTTHPPPHSPQIRCPCRGVPAAPPTPNTSVAARRSPWASRTSCSPRGSTTTARPYADSRTASPPSPVPAPKLARAS